MKTIAILLVGVLISCSMNRKQNKLSTMESVQNNIIEATFLKDTAIWIDGRTYQFIELVINEINSTINYTDLVKNYVIGMNKIYVTADSVISPKNGYMNNCSIFNNLG